MSFLLLKAVAIWVIFVVLAIVNANIRDNTLNPALGPKKALPVSGILLSVMIFLATWLLLPVFGPLDDKQPWLIGVVWLVLTFLFETLTARFLVRASWRNMIAAYNVLSGNLWLLVLLTTLVSPWLVWRMRALL